jgi:hypothetical protein
MPRRALTACLLLFATALPAFAQGAKDRVYFRDRATGKEETADGDVVDSPAGVKLTVAGKERVISAADVLRVDYAALDPAPGRVASLQAESKGGADAVKFYTDAAKAVPANAPEKVKRTVAFRDAYWAGEMAAGKDGGEFAGEAKKAADKMAAFVKAFPKSWEQWQTGRAAARLYGELEDWAAADAVLKDLGSVPDAPPELKQDAKLARVGYMIRGGKYPEASGALAEVEGDAKDGLKDRAVIYRAALNVLPAPADANDAAAKPKLTTAVTAIEKAIAASKDPVARAVGYGVLGEVQLAHRQFRAATWSFCWVDSVYTQDADERLFAVVRLVKIFGITGDKEGEKSRVDQYRERLPKVR